MEEKINITNQVIKGLQHKYTIEIPINGIQQEVDLKLTEMAAKVQLDGFRLGKVPASIVRQRYEKSTRADIIQNAVESNYKELIKHKNLSVAGHPHVDIDINFEENKDIAIHYSFEITPEVKNIPTLEKLEFTEYSAEITDSLIKNSTQQLLETFTIFEPLQNSRAVKNGDYVIIDYEGRNDDGKIPNAAEEDHALRIGDNVFLPDLEKQIIGMKPKDKREIKVKFPKDYHEKNLADKDAIFSVSLIHITDKIVPELDEEFAKKIGFKSLEDLKKKIISNMKNKIQELTFISNKKEILDILDKEPLEVPKQMLQAEIEQLKSTSKNNSEILPQQAEKRVKLGIILNQIAVHNKININEKEMQEAMLEQADSYDMSIEKIIAIYKKHPEKTLGLKGAIFENKTIEHIISKAKINKEFVTLENLQERVQL